MKTWPILFAPLLLVAQSLGYGASPTVDLELREVHLYSAGVGGFLYDAKVAGDGVARVTVPTKDVSDVLRSLEVRDPASSVEFIRVAAVKEATATPIETSSYIECLWSLRGESITIQTAGEQEFSGRLLALENSLESFADEMTERTRLTLVVEDKLLTFLLEEIQSVTLQDPDRQRELHEALGGSTGISQQQSVIEIGFSAAPERTCRVALFRPMPVWKATYLCRDDQLSLRVLANNTTDDDWNQIDLKIVDGRPVRFFVNVNDAVNVHRKSMSLPVGLPGLPPIFQETGTQESGQASLDANSLQPGAVIPADRGRAIMGGNFGSASGGAAAVGGMGGMMGGGMGGMLGGSGSSFGPPASIEPYPSNLALVTSAPQFQNFPGANLALSAAQQASTEGTGDNLVIRFDDVSIAAGSVHLLEPQKVECQTSKLSVFSEDYNDAVPLSTCRFANKTNVLYPAGPISFFEGQQFSGEAMLPELSPSKERWVSYGIDRAVRVNSKDPEEESTVSKLAIDYELKQIKVEKVVLQKQIYYTENRSSQSRELFIEREISEGWDDDVEQPGQITGSKVRFGIGLQGNESKELVTTRRRTTSQQLQFASSDVKEIKELIAFQSLTAEQSATLNEILQRRSQLTAQKSQLEQRENGHHDRVRELDRLVRIMSTEGLERDFVRKYAQRVEQKEEQIAAFSREIQTLKDAIAANRSFLNPIYEEDSDDEKTFDSDPFSN